MGFDIRDLDDIIARVLFGSTDAATIAIAGIIISAIVIVAVMIVLLHYKAQILQTFFVELPVIGLMTALGFLNVVVLIVMGMVIAIAFTSPTVRTMLGDR